MLPIYSVKLFCIDFNTWNEQSCTVVWSWFLGTTHLLCFPLLSLSVIFFFPLLSTQIHQQTFPGSSQGIPTAQSSKHLSLSFLQHRMAYPLCLLFPPMWGKRNINKIWWQKASMIHSWHSFSWHLKGHLQVWNSVAGDTVSQPLDHRQVLPCTGSPTQTASLRKEVWDSALSFANINCRYRQDKFLC